MDDNNEKNERDYKKNNIRINAEPENRKLNRKFLKFENGDIKHVREEAMSLGDIVEDGENNLRKKLKSYNKIDFLMFSLVLFLIIGPIFLYSYYLRPDDSVASIDSQINSIDNIVANEEDTKKEDMKKANIKENINDEKEVALKSISFHEFIDYFENESATLHNEIINKLEGYFNNKANRAGLQSLLNKNLKMQKDLYVSIELNEGDYKSDLEKKEIKALKEIIFNDILTTAELIEMTDKYISREAVTNIYKTKQSTSSK